MHNNNNNALASTHDKESAKAYLLRLINGNEELSEIEKRWCREKFIYWFELHNAVYKYGEPRECDKCQTTRYSNKYCERCISLHLQSLFDTWTSGNEIIDDFIHQSQQISSIYTATWTRGVIYDYDENKKEFTYLGSENVVLKSLNNSSDPGKSFFNEVNS